MGADGDDDGSDDDVKVKKEKKEKKDKKDKKDKKEKKEKKEKKDKKDKKEKKETKATKKDESDSGSEEKDSEEEEEEELKYDDEIMSSTVTDFVDFVKSHGDKLTVDKMYEEVRAQQVTKVFDNKLRMYVVVSSLFPSGSLDAKGVEN